MSKVTRAGVLDEVRQIINDHLSGKRPAPQVQVTRANGVVRVSMTQEVENPPRNSQVVELK